MLLSHCVFGYLYFDWSIWAKPIGPTSIFKPQNLIYLSKSQTTSPKPIFHITALAQSLNQNP